MPIPKRLINMTAFVDGEGYAGKVPELEPPKLALKMEEYRAGGMDAPVELEQGMEKLEATITFAEYDDKLFKLFGLIDGNAVSMTFRGARQDDNGTDAMIIEMKGTYKELDSGSWKTGEKGTLKATITCRYYKLTIGDQEIIEIDIENMVRRVNGVDQLEAQRQALGL